MKGGALSNEENSFKVGNATLTNINFSIYLSELNPLDQLLQTHAMQLNIAISVFLIPVEIPKFLKILI